jgi:hypothetical protein
LAQKKIFFQKKLFTIYCMYNFNIYLNLSLNKLGSAIFIFFTFAILLVEMERINFFFIVIHLLDFVSKKHCLLNHKPKIVKLVC